MCSATRHQPHRSRAAAKLLRRRGNFSRHSTQYTIRKVGAKLTFLFSILLLLLVCFSLLLFLPDSSFRLYLFMNFEFFTFQWFVPPLFNLIFRYRSASLSSSLCLIRFLYTIATNIVFLSHTQFVSRFIFLFAFDWHGSPNKRNRISVEKIFNFESRQKWQSLGRFMWMHSIWCDARYSLGYSEGTSENRQTTIWWKERMKMYSPAAKTKKNKWN